MSSEDLRNEPALQSSRFRSSTTAASKVQLPPGYSSTQTSYNAVWWSFLVSNRTSIAASCAAVTSVLAGFPFDSLKTRMQTHHYKSLLECFKTTYREEGARGFFRGMIPPLVTVSAIKSVSFTVYEGSKEHLRKRNILNGQSLPSLMGLSSLSGAASGAFIAVLSCPLELVKVQRQLEQMIAKEEAAKKGTTAAPVESSSWSATKQIVKRKGIFGLWSGFRCHSAREVLGTSIYFGTYETAKRILSGNQANASTGPMTHFFAGGICGTLSWLIVFPVDLIKSRVQKDVMVSEPKYNSSILACTADVVKRDGIRGLYRGLNVTLLRAFPIHSLQFLVLEYIYSIIPPSPSSSQ